MISLCGGLVLCHPDVIGQIVVVVTVPLDFLVRLRGCLILYVVNYVQPCYSEGFFNLPGQYFYRCEVCLRYLTKSLCATVFMQTVYSTVIQGYS